MELQKIIKAYENITGIYTEDGQILLNLPKYLKGFITDDEFMKLTYEQKVFIAGAYWANDQK